MAVHEKVYLNRDNSIKLGLTADGTPLDAATFTRVIAKLKSDSGTVYSFDSNTDTNAFDFVSETAQVVDTVVGILIMTLQDASTPPPVGEDYILELIIYDPANVNGVHWDSPFPVQVIDE